MKSSSEYRRPDRVGLWSLITRARRGLTGWRVLVLLGLVVVLSFIAFAALRAPVRADPGVAGAGSWITVQRGDFEEVCSEEGELRPAKVTTITFTDWAQLSWLIPEGTRVKKGDKVAEVNTERIEDELGESENELAQAERDQAQRIQAAELEKRKFEGEMEGVTAALELAKLKESELLAKPLPLEREEAKNLLESANARLEAAKTDLDAMTPLFEQGFGQRADLEDKKLAYDTALVELENARVKANRILAGATEIERGQAAQARLAADVAVRIKELERERALTDMQAKILTSRNWIKQLKQRIAKRREQMDNAIRYAPHEGIIVYREVGWHTQRKVEVGSWVGPWSSPLDLPNYEFMKVRTQVPESVVSHLTARRGPPDPLPGSKVRVRIKTLPDRDYPAEITWIDGWARDRNANLSEADARSEGFSGLQVFNVEVELLESDPDRLREGFRAIVDFPIQTHRSVLAIPRDAVTIRHGQATVRVKDGETAEIRPVVLGPESRDRVIVTEGLREGEQVFVPPTVEEQKSLSSQTRQGEGDAAQPAAPAGGKGGGNGGSARQNSRGGGASGKKSGAPAGGTPRTKGGG